MTKYAWLTSNEHNQHDPCAVFGEETFLNRRWDFHTDIINDLKREKKTQQQEQRNQEPMSG